MIAHRPQFEITLNGQKVRLGARTLIMGILNVTPDSFSDGGRYLDPRRAISHAVALARAGADWIDVGGESTRPGAGAVSLEEELRRVLPVIRGIRQRMPQLAISIDTTKSEVARQAIEAGASLVNDVSGLRFDPVIAQVVRRYQVPLVLMHLRGCPATMQQMPFARSIFRSIARGLEESIRQALALGVRRSQLVIDPGLGFGKTRRQNFEIIARLRRLQQRLRLPILVGTSRKSFIQAVVSGEGLDPHSGMKPAHAAYWNVTGSKPKLRNKVQAGQFQEAGNSEPQVPSALDFGDAAAVTAAILAGAHIVRVHHVGAALPAARIADAILEAGSEPQKNQC